MSLLSQYLSGNKKSANAPSTNSLSSYLGNGAPLEETTTATPQEQTPALPDGAKGFDPYGNPYFGEGLGAILKKWSYNFTKDVKDVDNSAWDDLKERWGNMQRDQQEYMRSLEQGAKADPSRTWKNLAGAFGMTTEAVSKGFQDVTASSQGSVLAPALKAVGASVTAIGDLFSIPAQKFEQSAGAFQGLREAAREIESPLPHLEQNWFTDMVESSPMGIAYDVASIALSQSDNKWDYTAQKIEEGWQAGRIYYSQVFDSTLKEKFLQEYRAGEDPALLAMKLQNPLAELGGQLIFDPLNLVGVFFKGAKTAAQLNAVENSVTASGLLKLEQGAQALEEVSKAADNASALRALDTLAGAQQEAVALVRSNSKLLNTSYGIRDLTTSSRQNAVISKGKELIGNMALTLKQNGYSNEGVAEMILYGARSVSENVDEMKAGLSGLAHAPNAHMWLSDDYIETFTVVRNLLADEAGILNGSKLRQLIKSSNPAEFSEAAKNLMLAAAKSEFPDVGEMEKASALVKQAAKEGGEISEQTRRMAQKFDSLPSHVKYLNRIDSTFSTYVKNPINKVLGTFYFNLQGGVAVRNIISNNELILVDKGFGAWFADGQYWTTAKNRAFLTEAFGELPESAHGFKSLVSSTTERPAFAFGKWMEAGEESGSARIVAASVRDTFKKMIPKAIPNMGAEVDAGALTQQQVRKFADLLYKHKGNATKAADEFRDLYKVGAVESWRNLDFVTAFEKDALETLDYWDDIEELARRGANTTDEVEAVFEKIRKSIDSRSELASNDVIGLSEDHPSAETWGDLMKAVEEGHLDPNEQRVFTAIMEGAEQARLEYQTLLDDVALKAQQALSRDGKLQEAQHIGQEMNRVRETLRKAAPATAKETRQITQDAWRWSDAIKADKKTTPETLKSYWTKAGLNGDPPLDLTKQSLLKELWKQRFEKVSAAWNSSFDAIVGESETILRQMSNVVDTTELNSMASRTRHISKQAQAMRSAVFENGALRIRPTQDMAYVAKQYGVKPEEILNAINNKKGTAFTDIQEIPTRDVMDVIKQARNERGLPTTRPTTVATPTAKMMEQATDIPRSELPPQVSQRFADEAARLASELSSGQAGKRTAAASFGTTNVGWYRELYKKGLSKPEIDKALDKIIMDAGKDKGVNVERMKDMMMDNFRFGDEASGTPPDLNVLKQLGADEKTLQDALDNFNDITKQNVTLEEAIRQSGGIVDDADLLHDSSLPYFDDAGNLIEPQGIAIPPPHPLGGQPSLPRAWNENATGAKHLLDEIKNEIIARWGETDDARTYSPELENALKKMVDGVTPKMAEMKSVALRVAEEQRNFTLLNYGAKTYGDVALSYLMPYHFFYTRSYKNWISRVATNPEIVAGYGKYKDALEKINADLPPWYQQQLNVTELLGIKSDHPIYLNLEATFNPLYGLTGTDFNDPSKRVNWATATFDDMGKFGPTMWAPLQMAVAAMLYKDGEIDAATRWGNRLIPQTAQIKAVSSFFGKPVELDPSVQMFSGNGLFDFGAMDPYERGRMGYAASDLIASGQYTPEQLMQQFQAQEGDGWDTAKQMAVNSRAWSSISSYFLGVGFKPRSTNDVTVEKMYLELNKLYALSSTMSPEEYRNQWEKLRQSYPPGLVDTVLLAKKGGAKRDAAYAYNVFGRLPPGKMDDVLKAVGISSDEVSKFYESKGFSDPTVKFTETEKLRFMAAVIDLGTMLKIPQDATQQEWNDARNAYSQSSKNIEKELGDDIWDKVSHYYDLKDDNSQEADLFKQQHPEVMQALQMRGAAIANDPLLATYYGGIDNIEAYVSGQVRQQLTDKYGAEIYQTQTDYFNSSDQRAYLRAHPELRRFWDEKRVLDQQAQQAMLHFASLLDNPRPAEFREDFTPQSSVQGAMAEAIQSLASQGQAPMWEDISAGMAPWLQGEVINYWTTGEPLSKRATKQLEFLAKQGGYYNAQDFLMSTGYALQSATQNAPPMAQPQPQQGNSLSAYMQGAQP